jgi:hypothetical protein
MRSLILVATAALASATAAAAYAPVYHHYGRRIEVLRQCTHGQQLCGHTCISRAKVCHADRTVRDPTRR